MTKEHKKYLEKIRNRKILIISLRVGILALFIGLWELLSHYEVIDPFIFSSPSRICKLIIKLTKESDLSMHVWTSFYETVIGFVAATFLGTLIAILLWCSTTLKDIMEPYLITLNSLPKIALGPIIIVWMGTGQKSIIFMAILICIIITIISMLTGFNSVENEKIMLMKSMRANKFQLLTKLVLPANIPNLISVLKINVGLSWIGSIMGEYLSSQKGLGYLLVYGSQVFQLDLVMASTVILCVLAGLMYVAVALLEKIVKKHFD